MTFTINLNRLTSQKNKLQEILNTDTITISNNRENLLEKSLENEGSTQKSLAEILSELSSSLKENTSKEKIERSLSVAQNNSATSEIRKENIVDSYSFSDIIKPLETITANINPQETKTSGFNLTLEDVTRPNALLDLEATSNANESIESTESVVSPVAFSLEENIDEEDADLSDYIRGEYNTVSNSNINFLYSIENNSSINLDRDTLHSVINYRKEANLKESEILSNKFNLYTSSEKNKNSIHNVFIDKFEKYKDFLGYLTNGIDEKTEIVKRNSITFNLRKEIYSNKGIYFNNVLNALNIKNKKKLKASVFEKDNDITSSDLIIKENAFLIDEIIIKNNLFYLSESFDFAFLEPIKTTSNDILIQSFVNLSRSINTISSNCFSNNYKNENKLYINSDIEKNKCILTEREGFNVFQNLGFKNTNLVPEDLYVFASVIKPYQPEAGSFGININTVGFFNEQNELNNSLFNVLNLSGNSSPLEVRINSSLKEINKIFKGSIFELNITDENSKLILDEPILNLDNILNNPSGVARNFPDDFSLSNLENINRFYLNFVEFQNQDTKARVYYKDKPISLINSNNFNDFDHDANLDVNDLLIKLKLDSVVKSSKKSYLENNNVNIDFLNQIITNINLSKKTNKMISYSKDKKHDFSILNENSKLYDLMFTKDGNTHYSHSDVISNHKVNKQKYRGLDEFKRKNLVINNNRDKIVNEVNNFISYYYPDSNFMSTSFLLYYIMSPSVITDKLSNLVGKKSTLTNKDETCQSLYFNFYKNNQIDSKTKDTVTKRFLKRVLMNCKKHTASSLHNKPLNNYSYKEINPNKYTKSLLSSTQKYLNDILSSSENLATIRDSVYSLKNIKEVSDICNYKAFTNCNIQDNNSIDLISEEEKRKYSISITGNIHYNLFPSHVLVYPFIITSIAKDQLGFYFDKIEKNEIKMIESDDNIPEFIVKKEGSLDITSNTNIIFRIVPKSMFTDTMTERRKISREFPYIEIEDLFDSVFYNANSVFYKIGVNILELLYLNVRDFNLSYFEEEKEIDTFIENNTFILSKIESLLEVYSDLHLIRFARKQRNIAKKYYHETLRKDFDFSYNSAINNSGLSVNGKIIDFDNEERLNNEDEPFKEISQELEDVLMNETAYNVNEISLSSSFSKNDHKTFNIFKSFMMSDVYQALNIDIINGFIKYQDKLQIMTRKQLSFSKTLDKIRNYLDDKFALFYLVVEKYFYNYMFINSLSKKLFNNLYVNNKLENFIKDGFENTGLDFYEKDEFFQIQQSLTENDILLTERFPDVDNGEEVIIKNYINSSFYTFGIKDFETENIQFNNLFKFTVYIVDVFNLNHIYLPKSYIFSPLFTKKGNLLSEDFSNVFNFIDKSIGYFNLDENIEKRLGLDNYENLIDLDVQDNPFYAELIKKKFNIENDELVQLIFNQIIRSHIISEQNEIFIKNIHGIQHIDDSEVIRDNDIIKSFYEIDDAEFFNIFDIEKREVFDNKGILFFPEMLPSQKQKDTFIFYELVNKLSKIGDYKEVFLKEYYETFTISVNPKDYYYYDITGQTSAFESDFTNNFESSIWEDSMISYIKTNIVDLPTEVGLIKKSTLNIDNIKVIIKPEII
jgi:hypothetical protein